MEFRIRGLRLGFTVLNSNPKSLTLTLTLTLIGFTLLNRGLNRVAGLEIEAFDWADSQLRCRNVK